MAGITQIVDGRIEQLRKERAELDELRASLEQREAELISREQHLKDDITPLADRKASLMKEIEDATAEVERLRAERYTSIENFGDEISKLQAEKNAEGIALSKQLQAEINILVKAKADAEEELEILNREITEARQKAESEKTRIASEKESFLTRTRAERETALKEINLAHSLALADSDRVKKELEDEIAALTQTKAIEWNKIQAEISRYRTEQLAELSAEREQFLAEAEKEKSEFRAALRAEERNRMEEISRQQRDRDREDLRLHAEKQRILDEIKLLEYEYEKAKSDNIVKLERFRLDQHKELEAERTEALARLADEQAVQAAEWKKQAAELRDNHRAEIAGLEKEIAEAESKKSALLMDIDRLEVMFNQARAENEAALETLRGEKLKEIDELRFHRLTEVENLRQKRIEDLENAYFEKATAFEAARAEKLEAALAALRSAEADLEAVKHRRYAAESEIEILRTESEKIKEENAALLKAAILERQLESEKYTNIKLSEIENICASRLSHAEELAKRMTAEAFETESRLKAERKVAAEELAELRMKASNLESELALQKEERLAEIQKDIIAAMEDVSKLKLSKLSEIEEYLEKYKQERLEAIQKDFERQVGENTRQVDELAVLNNDYNKRMKELQALSLKLEADNRNIAFKDQQISLLQDQLRNYAELEAENHALTMRLAKVDSITLSAIDAIE